MISSCATFCKMLQVHWNSDVFHCKSFYQYNQEIYHICAVHIKVYEKLSILILFHYWQILINLFFVIFSFHPVDILITGLGVRVCLHSGIVNLLIQYNSDYKWFCNIKTKVKTPGQQTTNTIIRVSLFNYWKFSQFFLAWIKVVSVVWLLGNNTLHYYYKITVSLQ